MFDMPHGQELLQNIVVDLNLRRELLLPIGIHLMIVGFGRPYHLVIQKNLFHLAATLSVLQVAAAFVDLANS